MKGENRIPAPDSLFSREALFDIGWLVRDTQPTHLALISPTQKDAVVKAHDMAYAEATQLSVILAMKVHQWMPDGIILVVGLCVRCSGAGEVTTTWPDRLDLPPEPLEEPTRCASCKGTGRAMCVIRVAEGQVP